MFKSLPFANIVVNSSLLSIHNQFPSIFISIFVHLCFRNTGYANYLEGIIVLYRHMVKDIKNIIFIFLRKYYIGVYM